ncbi:hypothetical protein SAMN04489807_0436 [Microbacterium hydrocarbonoxydans]|uniref:Uncharacterized protein n=1 Tax=Microbacterium hydrocarbonoxydans TaxID=273678 RepID=A0A1H4IZ19_9MICO|nr:hypothetical protein SAMN04489807_0436 [Microbacterium hydrocarbonoxydans]
MLRALVTWDGDPAQLTRELLSSPPFVRSGLVVLRLQDIDAAIRRFVSGRASAEDLADWAECVHTVEDIDLDDAARDLIAQALFELSTPELFGSMEDISTSLLRRISSS